MATGSVPFTGNTAAMIFNGILNETPSPVTGINSKMPFELDRIIAKTMEKDRDLRCQTAAEVARGSEAVEAGHGCCRKLAE